MVVYAPSPRFFGVVAGLLFWRYYGCFRHPRLVVDLPLVGYCAATGDSVDVLWPKVYVGVLFSLVKVRWVGRSCVHVVCIVLPTLGNHWGRNIVFARTPVSVGVAFGLLICTRRSGGCTSCRAHPSANGANYLFGLLLAPSNLRYATP